MFINEFKIENENDANTLIKFVSKNEVTNLNELNMKARIAKHVEYSTIDFDFSNDFKVENISDDAIVSMLDNIENRL